MALLSIARTARLVCAFFASACAAAALAAQSQPRFQLPDPPFDYTVTPLPAGPILSFPLGNVDRAAFNARAALGRVLFYEPRLSRNETRSCSSCHQQARGFADGQTRSLGFAGSPTRRNSMSIANLAFNRVQLFWDGRASKLEELVLLPIPDSVEMGMQLDDVVARLVAEPGYAELFSAAFGTSEVTALRLAAALATFVSAIVSARSRYDEGLAAASLYADLPNFSAAENRGKRLFFGTQRHYGPTHSCATCHGLGLQNRYGPRGPGQELDHCRNNGLDAGSDGDDPGLGGHTGKREDLGKFRAPSLHNVELTAPYMHDGRFATLEEVVRFYATGVHDHPNLDVALRPGSAWSSGEGATAKPHDRAFGMPMTTEQQQDLVAFLRTLTDRALVEDPRFADPFQAVPRREVEALAGRRPADRAGGAGQSTAGQ